MVHIDVRKLISFGKGSYIITMPKGWIEKNNLKKGDLISVDDGGFELVLSASQHEKKQDLKEASIEAKEKSVDMLKAEIVSSYLNGCDTINILFDASSRDMPRIKEIIRNLSGLEIMEQTSARITAKNLINVNEISINNIVRRMDIITRAMMEDVILCSRGQSNYESIYNRDSDVNRLFFLGYRAIKNAMKSPRIAKSLGIEPWQLHSDTLIILRIEKIADRQKRIARYLCNVSLDRTTLAELDKLQSDINSSYNEVMKAYYNQDRQLALDVEVTNKERTSACDKFLEKYTLTHSIGKNKTANLDLVSVAKVVENLKATAAEISNISRTVLCYE